MSERLRLRIESDGTAHGTQVTDTATGRLLPVQAVTWSLDVRAPSHVDAAMATATIVVPLVEVVLAAEADASAALHFRYPPLPPAAAPKTPCAHPSPLAGIWSWLRRLVFLW